MSDSSKPVYIEGIGFRREAEHTKKRWAQWKDARRPGTYFITLSVAAHQNILGTATGSATLVWQWLQQHHDEVNTCRHDPLYMKHAILGNRHLPFCKPIPTSSLPQMAEQNSARQHLKEVLPLPALQQAGAPTIKLSPLGKEVERCWYEISARHPAIETIMLCIMPNHLHAVICVNRDMEKTVGDAIAGFMRGTTMALRRMLPNGEVHWSYDAIVRELQQDKEQRERINALCHDTLIRQLEQNEPFGATVCGSHPLPNMAEEMRLRFLNDKQLPQLQRTGSKRRHGREQTAALPSLWEELYTATVCIDENQLNTRLVYTAENPFFKVLEQQASNLFERRLHLDIAGKDYAAYGNLFLLKEDDRHQIFCHRKARLGMLTDNEIMKFSGGSGYGGGVPFSLPNMAKDKSWRSSNSTMITSIPYIYTQAYLSQKETLLAAGVDGAVLVTPGISPGEADIIYTALAAGTKVIMIQADAITSDKWHPGKTLRACCGKGQLLIIAPWQPERQEYRDEHGIIIPMTTDYALFHDLNEVAAEICRLGDHCAIKRKR